MNTVFAVKRLIGRKFDVRRRRARPRGPSLRDRPGRQRRREDPRSGARVQPEEISAFILRRSRSSPRRRSARRSPRRSSRSPRTSTTRSARRRATPAASPASRSSASSTSRPRAALAYGLERKRRARSSPSTTSAAARSTSRSSSSATASSGQGDRGRHVPRRRGLRQEDHGLARSTTSRRRPAIDLRQDRMALQRLKEAAEKAKCELSTASERTITLPFISADASGPKHINRTLTREKFEALVADLIDRRRRRACDALPTAKPEAGGRGPGHPRRRADPHAQGAADGRRALRPRAEPRRSTRTRSSRIGAAIQGGVLKGEIKDIVLLDVTPLSLGIETHGGVFEKLIERNSTIPTEEHAGVHDRRRQPDSRRDPRPAGRARDRARRTSRSAASSSSGIPAAPRGVPQIEVTFAIDSNGIVNVSARDLATGKAQGMQINPAGGLSQSEIDRIIKEASAFAEADHERREVAAIQEPARGDDRVERARPRGVRRRPRGATSGSASRKRSSVPGRSRSASRARPSTRRSSTCRESRRC